METASAFVSFWSHPSDTELAYFVGTGMFISDYHILTARHLFFDATGQQQHRLWVRPAVNFQASAECVEIAFHPHFDIALIKLAISPDQIKPISLNPCHHAALAQQTVYMRAMFEGKLTQPEAVQVDFADSLENHYVINKKPPKGNSGGALLVENKLWAIIVRQYGDPNIHKGCAIALQQFYQWLLDLAGQELAGKSPEHPLIEPAFDASNNCQNLAALLNKPEIWPLLEKKKILRKLRQEVQKICLESANTLTSPQAIYMLCTSAKVPAYELLCKMPAVVAGSQQLNANQLRQTDLPLQQTIIAISMVLAERYLNEQISSVAEIRIDEHGVNAPVASEAISTLIAALWLKKKNNIDLKIGLKVEDGAVQALSALQIVNSPLEYGHQSAIDHVKIQVWQKLNAGKPVSPKDWKNERNSFYKDIYIPEIQSSIQKALGGEAGYDLLLTYNSDNPVSHFMAKPEYRAEVKKELGLWTVLYNAKEDTPAVCELAETIEAVFNRLCNHI